MTTTSERDPPSGSRWIRQEPRLSVPDTAPLLAAWPVWATIFGIALSIVAWRAHVAYEQSLLRAAFRQLAADAAHHFERSLSATVEAVHYLAALDAASDEVTRDEFAVFAREVLEQHHEIRALGWAPRVPAEARLAAEQRASAEGLPGFLIRESTAAGGLVPAATSAEHYPVLFVEPVAGNEAALGFDLLSEPARAEALRLARQRGVAVATGRLRLGQDRSSGYGALVLLPVRQDGGGSREREGFYLAAINYARILAAARRAMVPGAMSIELRDGPRLAAAAWLHAEVEHQDDTGSRLEEARSFRLAERTWWLIARSHPGWVEGRRTPWPLTTLAGSLTLSGAVCAYLYLQRRARERLRRAAYHDSLTGLGNRRMFLERLEEAQRQQDARPVTVLFIDVDRFKMINDSLGHAVGDELLVAIARRLQAHVRPHDLLARIGGDEFAILVQELGDHAFAVELAERLERLLREPFSLRSGEAFVTLSIGIATAAATEGGFERRSLLRDADIAMYRAKTGGRDRVVMFDRAMRDDAVRAGTLENELRQAVAQDQFLLLYQPIVRLEDGAICGFEVLVRWQHPALGRLSPVTFIALAEDTGLIRSIGESVLAKACDQIHVWQARPAGLDPALRLHVNVSPSQTASARQSERVERIIAEAKLPPGTLGVEITESAMLRDEDNVRRWLTRLREMGVGIHLDDFGTGYSSLSHLHRLPIDGVKIDQSFVRSLATSERDRRLVQAMVALSRQLELEVTAEGVETEEQCRILSELRCDYAQGYLFASPLTAAEAENMAQTQPFRAAASRWK